MSLNRHHVGKRLSEMVVHNGTVYLAGQVASDMTLDIIGQTQDVLASIDRLLGEVGSDKTKILTRATRRRAPPSRRSSRTRPTGSRSWSSPRSRGPPCRAPSSSRSPS